MLDIEDSKKDFKAILFEDVMPKVYGIGAAVVIVGAMFKILNWPGANLMIGIGLTTEAVIFFLSAFEPPAKDYDWTKAYPELAEEDEEGTISVSRFGRGSVSDKSYEKEIIDLTKNVKTLSGIYEKEAKDLGSKLSSNSKMFADSIKTMEEMQKASSEAQEFRVELEKLKKKISSLNDIYDNTLNALRS